VIFDATGSYFGLWPCSPLYRFYPEYDSGLLEADRFNTTSVKPMDTRIEI